MKRIVGVVLALSMILFCASSGFAQQIEGETCPPEDGDMTLYEASNDHVDKQWQLDAINASAIWENGITGEGVRIAILDTGIDLGHEDLNYNYIEPGYNYQAKGYYVEPWGWIKPEDVFDRSGHGTAVTGVISANRGNGIGIDGLLDKATIVPLKITGGGHSDDFTYATAIKEAVDKYTCDVISMSFNVEWMSYDAKALRDAVDYAVSQNVIVVVGAGNNGNGETGFLAGLDGTITVGAVGEDGVIMPFSQHNDSVFVTAPGGSMPALWKDNAYVYVNGTSMSTPHVTALAGVAKYIDPDITVDEFKALLIATSDDRGAPGWDEYYGYGVIDCEAFINTMLSDDWTPESVKVKRFRDVEGHWGKEGIGYVIEQGLFGGTSEYTFEPNVSMSRAMFATVLGRLYEEMGGSVETSGSSAFTDVKADSWYGKYVLWASESGLIDGYGDGCFGPGDDITREQMVLVLYRLSELIGKDVAGDESAIESFPDLNDLNSWAFTPMAWAVENGLITGVKENGLSYLNPSDSASRAQTAAILQRYMELYAVI